MHKRICAYLILLIAAAASAQAVKLSGVVSNQGGKPISGAIVTLKGQNIKDTTDSKGEYSLLKGSSPVRFSPSQTLSEEISLRNGSILFNLKQPNTVKIDIFDFSGNLLKRELNNYTSAGEYRFKLTTAYAAKMTAIRVSIGERSSTFRYLQIPGTLKAFSSSAATTLSNKGTLAKIQATLDSLNVTARNCTTKTVPVTSFEATLNVTMDTLPRFSFFITSLAALRILSKSTNGFGGDFRFGKTGQGAGLLGADSICSCIAEMSMKGARAKEWRAFLSASKGPDGKQVNAIDRIGSGPWYDRLGRLLANTTTELLSDRPSKADPAIKNDFPNEEGTPNHQPDPTKPAVDNHLTITGSDNKGKLYNSNSTCDDWTSTSGQGGSKPRAGMSWPQAFGGGMKNWISAWDMSGCQPGVDSTDASMAGKPGVYTIGNGGGYGGFYCFGLNP